MCEYCLSAIVMYCWHAEIANKNAASACRHVLLTKEFDESVGVATSNKNTMRIICVAQTSTTIASLRNILHFRNRIDETKKGNHDQDHMSWLTMAMFAAPIKGNNYSKWIPYSFPYPDYRSRSLQ